ncbi:hypothetical protein ACGFZR_06370 [Streptomyces sp. NPDC048241]|uniref:hypothetical protein n=1 Tax=Streptomyces sp. NPDC048241 TaxID=3365521 RepID=UPI00371745C0
MPVPDAVPVGDQVQRPQVGGQRTADAAFGVVERGHGDGWRQFVGVSADGRTPLEVGAEPRGGQHRVTGRGGGTRLLAETRLRKTVVAVQDDLVPATLFGHATDGICEHDEPVLAGGPTVHLPADGRPATVRAYQLRKLHQQGWISGSPMAARAPGAV